MDAIILQTQFGGPILAVGYIGLLLLLYQLPLVPTVFRPISKAGRMSLTTYITQSIVATTDFLLLRFWHVWQSRLGNGSRYCSRRVRYSSYYLQNYGCRNSEWVHWNGYGEKEHTERNLPNKEEKDRPLS